MFKRSKALHSHNSVDAIASSALWYLLAAMGLLNALMLLFMPWWVPAVGLSCIAWRAAIARGYVNYPKVWLKSVLAIGCFAGLVSYFGLRPVLDFFLCLLLLSVSLRLLELQEKQAAVKQVWIAFFVAMTVFIFDQTPLYSAVVYGIVVVLIGAVVASFTADKHLRERPAAPLKKSLLLGLCALPIWLLLFAGMPRMGPLWHMPLKQAESAKTGMSDSLSPGDIVNLSESDELVMRATFADELPARSELYWLAMYLDRFDGKAWREGCQHCYQFQSETVADTSRPYQIILEPHQQHWLYAIVPSQFEAGQYWRAGDVYRSARPLTKRKQFVVYQQQARRDVQIDRERYLQLPKDGNLQTRQWVASLRAQGLSDAELLANVLHQFKQQFSYTLTPPALGEQRIDEFLFNTRTGYCEHFASSLVFAMRAAGIPARVAVGYMGGEINQAEKLVVVRQHDAHAWVEVWLDKHWQRIDPTAYVAPERIARGFSSYELTGASAAGQRLGSWLHQWRQKKDLVDYWWARWVLGYSNADQASAIERLRNIAWLDALRVLVGTLLLAAVVALIYVGRSNRVSKLGTVLALYRDTIARYQRAGIGCHSHFSPAQNAQAVIGVQRLGVGIFERAALHLHRQLYSADAHTSVSYQCLWRWLLINVSARLLNKP